MPFRIKVYLRGSRRFPFEMGLLRAVRGAAECNLPGRGNAICTAADRLTLLARRPQVAPAERTRTRPGPDFEAWAAEMLPRIPMKKQLIALLWVSLTGSSLALAVDRPELDRRIHALGAKFALMQSKADRSIPAETLAKARGVILLDRTKAGFLFAYQGGGGVALVRDEQTDQWGPAAFLSANEASLGFQIGGQQSFFVILLMNTNATRLLTEPTFELGGEARG